MRKDTGLETAVLRAIYTQYSQTPSLKSLSGGDETKGVTVLRQITTPEWLNQYSVMICYGFSAVAYGYDFRQEEEEGMSVKEIYEKELEQARTSGRQNNGEIFITQGMDERFGWYITEQISSSEKVSSKEV